MCVYGIFYRTYSKKELFDVKEKRINPSLDLFNNEFILEWVIFKDRSTFVWLNQILK